MLQAEDARTDHSQIPFSLNVREGKDLRTASKPANSNFSVAEVALRPSEINLSGAQVLLGSVVVLASIGSFLWVLIKLWAFGR